MYLCPTCSWTGSEQLPGTSDGLDLERDTFELTASNERDDILVRPCPSNGLASFSRQWDQIDSQSNEPRWLETEYE
jgi:hypothetical protein